MIEKGIILAGGKGTRLSPVTKSTNKQLLPIYDKPLFFYPLSNLMLADIRKILIIVNKGQIKNFHNSIGNGNHLGIKIFFKEQKNPNGIPESFKIGKKFIGSSNVALILGDNFFYGQSLTKILKKNIVLKKGARIFLHPVKNPNLYGVATVNKNKKVIKLIEKPKKSKSNLAVTGLYFFDNQVINLSKSLRPSSRNEIEIIDLLNKYKRKNLLKADFIGRGGSWLDTGNIRDFYDASNFISAIENRQGLKIACLEEIALNNNWINKNQINQAINFYGKCDYSKYLKSLIA